MNEQSLTNTKNKHHSTPSNHLTLLPRFFCCLLFLLPTSSIASSQSRRLEKPLYTLVFPAHCAFLFFFGHQQQAKLISNKSERNKTERKKKFNKLCSLPISFFFVQTILYFRFFLDGDEKLKRRRRKQTPFSDKNNQNKKNKILFRKRRKKNNKKRHKH